jgi:hypothetical protein
MPRTGDIIIVADTRKWCFGTVTRIFSPGDSSFSVHDFENIFNTDYPTHSCQSAEKDGKFVFKDTKEIGLCETPIDTYCNLKNGQKILAAFRSVAYDSQSKRDAFNRRFINELPRFDLYGWQRLAHDFSPTWLKVLIPPIARRWSRFVYCSLRVYNDCKKDGVKWPVDAAPSPADLYVYCLSNGMKKVTHEYCAG